MRKSCAPEHLEAALVVAQVRFAERGSIACFDSLAQGLALSRIRLAVSGSVRGAVAGVSGSVEVASTRTADDIGNAMI